MLQGGQFMLELVDHFGANFVIYVMATLEVMAIAWVYGLENFIQGWCGSTYGGEEW